MFHKPTGQIAAILMLASVSALPMASFASEPPAPAAAAPSSSPSIVDKAIAQVEDFSLVQLQNDTEIKIFETKEWIKERTPQNLNLDAFQDLDVKIENFQDRISPAGDSLKSAVMKNAPGKGFVQSGERKFSVFGLILMAAFGAVLFLMGSAGPESRLGGRH